MRLKMTTLLAASLVVGTVLFGMGVAQEYIESPYDAAKVAAGELPPLGERLPDTPMVYPVTQEIGEHGGQFNVFALDNFPWNALTEEPARGPLALLMTQDNDFIPDIVLDYKQSDDNTSFELYLRPGMKWSNGDDFTSEDFTFKREYLSDDGWQKHLYPEGSTVEAPDDHTVIINFPGPRPRALLDMIHWRGGEWTLFNPSNYLKTWHPDFNENAEAVAKEEGFASWEEAFKWHYYWRPLNDANKPTSQQWKPLTFTTTAKLYERNPFFHQVDAAGQQLPYVDTVLSTIVDPETFNLKVVSGEADLAYLRTSFDNYTLYMENKEEAGYEVNLIPQFTSSEVTYYPNQSHPDPVKKALFTNANFRRALSVAIDRNEINEILFNGFAVPQQWSVTSMASIYEEEWGTAYAQYDPDLANELLDGLGLTRRNAQGTRIQLDGKPLTIVVEFVEGSFAGAALKTHELVKEYWSDIGVQSEIRPVGIAASATRAIEMNWDVWAQREPNGEMYGTVISEDTIGFRNEHWERWREATYALAAGTKTLDDYGGEMPGEEPPPEINWLLDVRLELMDSVFGSEEYTRLGKQYYQFLSDNTYAIGTVGELPMVFLAKPNIGNLPTELPPWIEWGGDLNHYSNQWFIRSGN